MSTRTPFQYAVSDPQTRRDIALAVESGISPEQLAAEFDISETTVRAYAAEWAGTRRRVAVLTEDDKQQILDGVKRGAKARYVRQFGRGVVDEICRAAGIPVD
ncbi:COG3415 family protein [Mycobacteroides abscessus]|uniref:helix-turn-helix domain-containing protein n=1 Tax=Mycobacteroides abscessus TaxID=36809 RepID=UPI00267097B6|nr:helix-turn-helix domain-containing protein [Mycobacteroides abscessus]MDO3110454.1 helix-turn-helix domain-containing protein [Mycobacteroides abscessus subsp. abscessus]